MVLMNAKYGQVRTATVFFSHSKSNFLDSVSKFSKRRAETVADIVHSGLWTVHKEKTKKKSPTKGDSECSLRTRGEWLAAYLKRVKIIKALPSGIKTTPLLPEDLQQEAPHLDSCRVLLF